MLTRRLRSAALRRAPLAFLRWCEPTTAELGECGEELAARHLRGRGWRLLGRRVATPHGEIDIVATLARELACIEVKTSRSNPFVPIPAGGARGRVVHLDHRWRPGLRLTRRRLERQRRAGRYLAPRLGDRLSRGGRVDLVEVWVFGRPPRTEIVHHADLSRAL